MAVGVAFDVHRSRTYLVVLDCGSCLPFDLVVMPIWLLQLAGEKTGLRTVSFFVGNVVLFVVIATTAGPHLPAELRGDGPLAVAATAFLRSVTSRR